MADEKPQEQANGEALAKRPTELPEAVARRGVTEFAWRTLCNSLFPGCDPQSVLMVVDYCKARGLDPLKKPVHIVPMEVKNARTGNYEWRDVVMPGIYEYRTTAHRTGEYLGHTSVEYGPEVEYLGLKAPEWCSITVYRWNAKAAQKEPFPVQVFFAEVVATKFDKQAKVQKVNARWTRAPKQMLAKCAEAAAIREAFPEEIGGEPTADEMDGQRAIDITAVHSEQVVSLLDRLPEGLRDNVERALAALKLSAGQRQVKINEFLSGENVDLEDGAGRLLKWAEAELKAPAKTAPDNGKRTNMPVVEATVVSRVDPSASTGSGDSGAGREQTGGASGHESPSKSEPMKANELNFNF